jgi:hypothetical protein
VADYRPACGALARRGVYLSISPQFQRAQNLSNGRRCELRVVAEMKMQLAVTHVELVRINEARGG